LSIGTQSIDATSYTATAATPAIKFLDDRGLSDVPALVGMGADKVEAALPA